MPADKKSPFQPVTLEAVKDELAHFADDAVQYMWSENEADWVRAEDYYAGRCDLVAEVGRSNAVKTEVRDVIRAILPSIMRVLYQSRKPVEYIPDSVATAALVEQQALFVTQLFKKYGGYSVLSDAVLHALVVRAGPIKVWWESDPRPEHMTMTALDIYEVEDLKADPEIEVLSVNPHESPIEGNPNEAAGADVVYLQPIGAEKLERPDLYDVECVKYFYNGRIRFEAFPIYEFFCSREGTTLEDCAVHGHRRQVTVADAIDLGLEYPDWGDLSDENPDSTIGSGSVQARRGHSADQDDTDSVDPLKQKFLLTECYCQYDLKGTGKLQRYRFWLGGTDYTYIDHEEIDDYCIDLVVPDKVPFTVIGRSIPDLTIPMQDDESSILRAIIDSAHIANNSRLAGDPTMVDFEDLMNNAIGAPIKMRNGAQIQQIDTNFTGAALLPFLEYMSNDTEERVGVTKAATGLDPSALQSTDKEAVRNTIQNSQGQIELMVRNIAETGLVPLFRKALKLSVKHMDRKQVIQRKGKYIPIDLTQMNSDLAADPKVGLGTANAEQRSMTLQFILSEQKTIIQTMGMDNPFTSLSLMYNTYEDLVELGGVYDVGRYFSEVTPDVEQAIREQQEAAAAEAAENAPMDAQEAFLQAEQLKAEIKRLEIQASEAEGMRKHQLEQKAHGLNERRLALDAERYAVQAELDGDKLEVDARKTAYDAGVNFMKMKSDLKGDPDDGQSIRESVKNGSSAAKRE